MSYFRKVTATVLLIVLFCFSGISAGDVKAAESTNPLKLYAQSAILMDAGSGRILYEKNGFQKMPMASTTKIMTCILALEYGNLDDYVEVSAYAAGMPKVKLGMRSGEAYRLEDLLYSLMLESHNDSAVAIAEHIGGSVEGFAKMMNQKARDLGCYDTYFITPNGLDASAVTGDGENRIHSTTAADLASIMTYCIMNSPKKDDFLKITGTASYQMSDYKNENGSYIQGSRSFFCSNHNAFLNMMDGALSGKTGFTGKAGYCYVGALQRGERTYIVALLACGWPNNKSYKWSDTKALMNYGLENYEYHALDEAIPPKECYESIEVEYGQTDALGEKAYVPVEISRKVQSKQCEGVLLNENEAFQIICKKEKILKAPVCKGDEVGSISYLVGEEVYKVEYLVASEDVPEIDFAWCFHQILCRYGNFNKEVFRF